MPQVNATIRQPRTKGPHPAPLVIEVDLRHAEGNLTWRDDAHRARRRTGLARPSLGEGCCQRQVAQAGGPAQRCKRHRLSGADRIVHIGQQADLSPGLAVLRLRNSTSSDENHPLIRACP